MLICFSLTTCFSIVGSLIITSGLFLNTAVAGGMLIFPQTKIRHTTSVNNPEYCDKTNSLEHVEVTVPHEETSIIGMISNILRSPALLISFVNAFLFYGGLSIVFTHTVAYGIYLGHSHDLAIVLMSLIGLSNIFGRLFLGCVGQLRRVNIIFLYFIALTLAGQYM